MNGISALAPTNPRGQLRVRFAAVALAALSLTAVVTPGIRGSLTHALSRVHLGKSIPAPKFSDPPTDDDFLRTGLFAQPLIPVGPTSPDENRKLAALLVDYNEAAQQGEPDAVQPLADFAAEHPGSPWTPGLEVDLGAVYRQTGHFSRALVTWQSAWDASRNLTSSDGRIVGDMAGAYLSQFEAYLGRKELLVPLMHELARRPVRGSAAELVAESSRGLAEMESRPEVSFKCGPSALARILQRVPTSDADASRRVLFDAKSTPNGLSLSAVQAISVEAGMHYQMAYRSAGAPIVTPAVAHWKMGHYAAVLGRTAYDGILVSDATFGEDVSMTQSTFDEESSGYFLVPAGSLPAGWRAVGADEGGTVWGRGNTGNNHDNYATGRDEIQAFESHDCEGFNGCTNWNVEAAIVGVELRDEPVGYKPPFGPDVPFKMTYSHRDSMQPAKFAYTNFGNKWTFEWLSYVVDGGGTFYGDVVQGAACAGGSGGSCQLILGGTGDQPLTAVVARRGGGGEPYVFPNTNVSYPSQVTTTQTSAEGQLSQSYLIRNVTNGVVSSFTRRFPDDSVEKFTLALGTPGAANTKFFLTEVDDPQGNAVRINYDPNPNNPARIVSIVDAAGQKSTICYTDSPAPCAAGANPPASNLQVTQIVDPFGRSARFGYDAATGHLTSITDVLGIKSSYQYAAADAPNPDFVTQLSTPYGTTTFSYADPPNPLPPLNPALRSVTVTESSAIGNDPVTTSVRTSYVEFRQGNDSCTTRSPNPPGIAAGSTLDTNGIQCIDGDFPQAEYKLPAANVTLFNKYLQYRNTFVWNPAQYAAWQSAPSSKYQVAKLIHWLHTDTGDTNAVTASRIPESIKEPLESRTWFSYPNQSSNVFAAKGESTLGVGGTNQPSSITRAVGDGTTQIWQYQYDDYGHVTQSVDPVGRTLTMTYDAANHVDLLSVTNTTPAAPATATTPARPATNDSLLTLGNYVRHRPGQITGADGQTTYLSYNAVGQLSMSMDPTLEAWTYEYTPGPGMVLPAACQGSANCGNLTWKIGSGVTTSTGAFQSPSYTLTYDAVGRVHTAIGPDQRLLTFSYDDADRLIQTLFPDGTTEKRGYTFGAVAGGAQSLDLTSFIDRASNKTVRKYNGFRELVEVDEPSDSSGTPRATTLMYWPDRGLRYVQAPGGQLSRYATDIQGRAVEVEDTSDNSMELYSYDPLGRLVMKSPDGNPSTPGAIRYAYNLDDTVSKATLDWRAPTVFSYDPAYRRLTGWSRIKGGTWAQPTCATGWTCSVLDQESYEYNTIPGLGANQVKLVTTTTVADMNVTAPALPDGVFPAPTIVQVSYPSYDKLGRPLAKEITWKKGGASGMNALETFKYDALGRLTSDVNALDSFTYAYSDTTPRVTGRASHSGPQLSASYFPAQQDGLLKQLTYTSPSAAVLAQYGYTFDVRHNVTSFSDSNAGTTSNAYDSYSQLRTATLPGGATLTATPDRNGNVLSVSTAGPQQLNGSSYFTPSTSTAWAYDSANKMTQLTTTVVSAAGASTVAQPVTSNVWTGSIESIGASTPAGQRYGYDGSNRLASYAVGDATPPAHASGFTYDGLGRLSQVWDDGRRVSFSCERGSPCPTTQTNIANHSYIWCGDRICLEIDNRNQTTLPNSNQTTGVPDALYVAQGQAGNPTSSSYQTGMAPAPPRAYDITDMLGSERAVVMNNAIVASYTYDTFGKRSMVSGSDTASNRGFTGLYYHAASGLQFARNRVYNASLARWMTRDPIGNGFAFDDPERFNATDLNLYAYVDNNPQSMVDPSGNEGKLIGRLIKWFGDLPVIRNIGRVSKDEACSLMRRDHGVVSETEQQAKQFAEGYSAREGGPGLAEKDPGHRGGDPHYHGIGPDGDRLPGHSWWGAGALFLLDENGNGELDWGDIEVVDNFLPGPMWLHSAPDGA